MKDALKIWRTKEYAEATNPTPGEIYRTPILGEEDRAKDVGGIVVVLPAGKSVPYHYHEMRESLVMVLSGAGVEVCDDKEYPIRAGDVIFIPAGAKHAVINRSDREIRFLEFFTYPPMMRDFIKVE
jgi:quercetin dioxygenase-like cupin family protein